MISLESLTAFLAAGIMLNLTPGPDMLYVTARSVSQGRLAGLVSALAIGAGCLVHLAAAALGISALLAYSATAFTVLKLVGAAYLVFLGVKAWRSGASAGEAALMPAQPLARVFAQGVVVNVLNPKVALFFLAFLPQFVDPSRSDPIWQVLLLGALFNLTGTLVNCLVALGADKAGGVLRGPRFARFMPRLSGSIYILMGLGLALCRRD